VLSNVLNQTRNLPKSSNRLTLGAQSAVNSPPAPCLDLRAISSAISLKNMVVRSSFEHSPDVFGSLLECPSLVPELSNLVQKDPNLASKSFGEIIDISTFDGSAGRGELEPENELWGCATGIVGTSLDFVGHFLGLGPTEISGWLDGKAM